MKINVYPIISCLGNKSQINKVTNKLLKELENEISCEMQITNIENLYSDDLGIILVQSGGSEVEFLKVFDQLKPPFLLLTYGENNSLAASIEILSFLKNKNLESEVLHGSNKYIGSRIRSYLVKTNEKETNLGVIGAPSDWLIASKVDYTKIKRLFNINLIDISINEIEDKFKEIRNHNFAYKLLAEYDKKSLEDAENLSLAIEETAKKYSLEGLTIRCFDILNSLKTTACLSLALLNSNGKIGTCEGDIPSMISMYFAKRITGEEGFQANPSSIDVLNHKIIFAHCTVPLNMCLSYKFDSHFESGIGVGIKGELKQQTITIFKLSPNMDDYFVTSGKIIRNLNEKNLCRTQIEIHLDNNIEYFLRKPFGNHHIIIYGDHVKEINDYFSKKFNK